MPSARPSDSFRHGTRTRVAVLMACALAWPGSAAWAAHAAVSDAAGKSVADSVAANAHVEFDAGMLSGASRQSIDLSRFEQGVTVLPGMYNVDVYLNQQWKGRLNVRFAASRPDANAQPCMSGQLVTRMGLAGQLDAATTTRLSRPGTCVQLGNLVAGARTHFDMSRLRLNVTVPQARMGHKPRGYMAPAAWDAGIPAFLLNYRLNAYHTNQRALSRTNAFLSLDAGLNIGLWRLRQHATATWTSGQSGAPSQQRWHTLDAYARRALPALKAELTLGDSHTDGVVFDSFALRGVQLSTDDRMRPQSRRGYAPVVRGAAATNAKITIRQNGVQIYQTTVPPGPFVINDLYPSGYGGNLQVTVTEADGRQHTYVVPYTSVAQLVRPGVLRFNVDVGQLRNMPFGAHQRVIQGAIQYGVNNAFTIYGGFQGSNGYAAALIGGALNTHIGALALDITEAGITVPGQTARTGRSMRLTWSDMLSASHTRVRVAAYRYSTRGFLSLTEAAIARAWVRRGVDTFVLQTRSRPTLNGMPNLAHRAALNRPQAVDAFVPRGLFHQRNRFTLSLSQPLSHGGGSLYANVSFRDYWNHDRHDTSFQLGYNNHVGRVSYGISTSRTRSPVGRFDNRIYVHFSLPLGSDPHTPTFAANIDHDSHDRTREQAMLTGSAGRYNQLNWGATAAHDNTGSGSAISAHAGYRSPYAVLHAGYGKGNDYSQTSFGASGAVLIHAGGITFGQPTGHTVALVHAPGAAGAHVLNGAGVRVDRHGYALVPYLAPYQLDTIRIDPRGLSLGVQLDATSAHVAPYAGAMVQVDFKTHYGRALIARIRQGNGKPAPFGTPVLDIQGNPVGLVGQAGLALLRVDQPAGHLGLHWKDARGTLHACTFDYAVPSSNGSSRHAPRINVTCTTASQVASRRHEGEP